MEPKQAKLQKLSDFMANPQLTILREVEDVSSKVDTSTLEIKQAISSIEFPTFPEIPEPKDDTELLTTILEEVKKKPDFEDVIVEIIANLPEPIDGKTPTNDELLALIRPLIPKVENGLPPTDTELLALILPLVEAHRAEFKTDTPEQIRDKLETLKKDDRLDKSAIKGLEKLVDEERAISILDSRTSFLINKINNLPPSVVSSGSQTPWLSNIDGAGFKLSSADIDMGTFI